MESGKEIMVIETIKTIKAFKCSSGHLHESFEEAKDCEFDELVFDAFQSSPSGFYRDIGGDKRIREFAQLLRGNVYPNFRKKLIKALEYLQIHFGFNE